MASWRLVAAAAFVLACSMEPVTAADCGAGTYYWGVWSGRDYCVRCPTGYTSAGCRSCKPDPRRTSCTKIGAKACPRGKFDDGSKTSPCINCPVGKWQSGVGKTLCYACPSGMFQPSPGLHSCYWCPHGQYFAKTGAERCDKCNACAKGTYGTTLSLGAKDKSKCLCKKCSIGQYTAAGYQTCFACPAGRFQASTGAYSCYYCSAGKYASTTGNAACTTCPRGRTTAKKGSASQKDCVASDCAVGRYKYVNPATKTSQCVDCAAGQYGSMLLGKSTCTRCPSGQHQSQAGQSSCKACPTGQFQTASATGCESTLSYTARFAVYSYRAAASLKQSGWVLLSYRQLASYKALLQADYVANGGVSMMGTWSSTGCCLTVDGGYRLTADGRSFVYPYDSRGRPACGASTRFDSKQKYRLAFSGAGGKTLDLSHARALYAAGASGSICGRKADEHNPGIYMRLTRGMVPGQKCFKYSNSLSLCVHKYAAPAVTTTAAPPTVAPTRSPTPKPTGKPTPRPTPKPTPATVDCQVSSWGPFSACSRSCGGGSRVQRRVVTVPPAHGGKACPPLSKQQACGTLICPSDCQVRSWTSWSSCAATCYLVHPTAIQLRYRAVAEQPQHGGKACPPLRQKRLCGITTCPVDCTVGAWGAWSACSSSCGGGGKARARAILSQPRFGGSKCPTTLTQTDACNAGPCPVHCSVGLWGAWSKCAKTCGGGFQFRMRNIVRQSMHGGTTCPSLTDAQQCNTAKCPVDCLQQGWSAWSTCTATCGGGRKVRSNAVLRRAAHGGKACTATSQSAACAGLPCPIDCKLSEWSAWTKCSKSCGSGQRTRTRVELVTAAFGGRACGVLKQAHSCATKPCPLDCRLGAWLPWGTCTKTCGGGTQRRFRLISQHAAHGGRACGPTSSTRSCGIQGCPVHCTVSKWQPWGACTHSCGAGQHQRYRKITQVDAFGGLRCPPLSETGSCGLKHCPIDCAISQWSSFNICSTSCGVGAHERTRTVTRQALHGGRPCPGNTRDVRACSKGPCPIHCKVSQWGVWSQCSLSCGGGARVRRRVVVAKRNHGGVQCPALTDMQICGTAMCPVDCTVGGFGPYGTCSKTCGGGIQRRTRIVGRQAGYGGKPCPPLTDSRVCGTQVCPVDCVMGAWRPWGACPKTCGTGWQERTRDIVVVAKHGGVGCSATEQQRTCSRRPCPIDCVVGQFSDWTDCTASCGSGQQKRSRGILRLNAHGGKACPTLLVTQVCNDHRCPVDCVVSKWHKWSVCTKSCLGGTQSRSRTVVIPAQMGGNAPGAPCPALVQHKACAQGPCPIDCAVGTFNSWSACSVTCGGGWQSRTRNIISKAFHGGSVCPALSESRKCSEDPCPVDCVVEEWSAWSACSLTCGTGVRERVRLIFRKAAHGGKSCPALDETELCNTDYCPVDCVMSKWSAWDHCNRSCGGGTKQRHRSVKVDPLFGGLVCGALSEQETCASNACPVDCVVTDYGSWNACSATCGGGQQARKRSVKQAPSAGGQSCPTLQQTRSCSNHACPVDCVVGGWSDYSRCSVTCGKGTRERSRTATIDSAHGGKPCPSLKETASCNPRACPIDCLVSGWTAWGACSATCGAGTQQRTRRVTRAASAGGVACPSLVATEDCNEGPCPVHCVMENWGSFGRCSLSCGGGHKTRERNILQRAQHGGFVCPHLSESVGCNTEACPVDCVVGKWTWWSMCTASCGTGTTVRSRVIKQRPQYGGKSCPLLVDEQYCNTQQCPVDCTLSPFSAWSKCSKTCGGGVRHRSRSVRRDVAHGGKPCSNLVQTEVCKSEQCPIDCIMGPWRDWSTCDASCDGGTQRRSRSVLRAPKYGGKRCTNTDEHRSCREHACPKDCIMGSWDNWDPCTRSCGGGTRMRVRSVVRGARNGGKPCGQVTQTAVCNHQPCPLDCIVSAYDAWQPCTQTCGTAGVSTRLRSITRMAANGGKPCPPQEQTKSCNRHQCPVDCKVAVWNVWSPCSVSCGGGSQERTRQITRSAMFGGATCPETHQVRACAPGPCPVHCEVSAWGAWTACSKSCGGGTQTRTRTVTVQRRHKGDMCPALKQAADCGKMDCPVDCVLRSWSDWSSCTHSCGGGTRSRSRSVRVAPSHGGKQCAALQQTQTCKSALCPIDCVVSEFGKYSECDKTCGGGTRTRFRSVKVTEAFGGVACPTLQTLSPCNAQPCPVDCVVEQWSSWSLCSKSCGRGQRRRSRTVLREVSMGGAACPPLAASESCADAPCPVDCRVGAYGFWGPCSVTCGGGTRSRARPVQMDPRNGGVPCPTLTQTEPCNVAACPVDCKVSEWRDWTGCDKTCGTGINTRGRTVLRAPLNGGKPCPLLREQHACNARPCPVHCEQTAWGAWGNCDRSCGGGKARRQRSTTVKSEFGGIKCGGTSHTKSCNTTPCPEDCVVAAFGAYSECSAQCNTGTKVATRKVVRYAQHGGKPCPATRKQAECNHHCCTGYFGGNYIGKKGESGKCQACRPGQYQPVMRTGHFAPRCLPCAPGRFQAKSAQDGCFECAAGRFSSAGSIRCTDHQACPAGKYLSNLGLDKSNGGECISCKVGTFKGHLPAEINSYHVQCEAVLACPAGQWRQGASATSPGACVSCAPGMFKETKGDYATKCSTCVACRAGHKRIACGSTSAGKCAVCPHGQYKLMGIQGKYSDRCHVLAPCPAGAYRVLPKDASATGSCRACPNGQYKLEGLEGSWRDRCAKHVPCPTGQYHSGSTTSLGDCAACAAGQFMPQSARWDAQCQACPRGRFQPSTGATSCGACPDGHWQDQVGALKCHACAAGKFGLGTQYATSSNKHCQACPKGKFQTRAGASSCTVCQGCSGGGVYLAGCAGTSGGRCQHCAKGQYKAPTTDGSYYYKMISKYPDWEDQCTKHSACGAGWWKDVTVHSAGKCRRCAAGRFKETADLSKCDSCATLKCPAGQYRIGCNGASRGKCMACEPGTYSNALDALRVNAERHPVTKCLMCPKGKYASTPGSIGCAVCVAGTYASASGAASCTKCGAGRFSNVNHASNIIVCQKCAAGRYQGVRGSTSCHPCPVGTASTTPNAVYLESCIPCRRGTWSGTAASTQCTKCKAGQHGVGAGLGSAIAACKDCRPGTYSDSEGAMQCKACEKGTYGHHKGQHCVKCPKGQYQSKDGESKCGACPEDTFQQREGSKTCTPCKSLNRGLHRYSTHGDAGQLKCRPVPLNCVLSKWSSFGPCSVSCGSGTRRSTRKVLHQAWAGGLSCAGQPLEQVQSCSNRECGRDCAVTGWSEWGLCSKECGWGKQTRTRKLLALPKNGGKPCPALQQTQACRVRDCGCSHVMCRFAMHKHFGVRRIEVLHHNKESLGSQHVCGYDRGTGTCTCECKGVQVQAPSGPKGRYYIADKSLSQVRDSMTQGRNYVMSRAHRDYDAAAIHEGMLMHPENVAARLSNTL